MNDNKNINISENAQNINIAISKVEVKSQEDVVNTEVSAPVLESSEIEGAEIIDIEIDEAFPSVTSTGSANHSLLHGRDLPEQHPISSITNLDDELNNLKKVKRVYSSESGVSEFRKWYDNNPDAENRNGYFVTIVDGDKIKKCDSTHDVYGISVDTSGFVGNQDELDKSDNYVYAMVGIVGAMKVRTDGTARVGEYVIPNKYGEATFSELGYGYKVLSEGSTSSYQYVVIAVTPQSDALSRLSGGSGAGSGSGSGDFSDIIIEINGVKDKVDNLEVKLDGTMSEDDIKDIINENLDNIQTQVSTATDIANAAQASAQLAQSSASVAASTAANAQQVAQSAAQEAINTANNAAASAQGAVDAANQALQTVATNEAQVAEIKQTIDDNKSQIQSFTQQLNDTNQSLTLIQQTSAENKTEIIAVTKQVDEHGSGLASIQQLVESNVSAIESVTHMVHESGESIASIAQLVTDAETIIQHLTAHVDKYAIGEYSLSYGLTLEEAQDILTSEHTYVPTIDHTETMSDVSIQFRANYIYEWDGNTWLVLGGPISLATSYHDGEQNDDFWYVWDNDVRQFDDNNQVINVYLSGTLYKWFETKWVAVATTANNHSSRMIASVRQTADGIRSDVTNLAGDVSTVKQTADDLSATVEDQEGKISSIEARADQITTTVSGFTEQLKGVNQQISSIQSGVEDNTSAISLINSGRLHLRYADRIEAPPKANGNKYTKPPVWDDERGVFVFNDDFVDNDNGIYYFYSDDHTEYCKVVGDNHYEIYIIGNKVTSMIDSRVTETESKITELNKFATDTQDTLTSVTSKADENSASINSLTARYYHPLLGVSENAVPMFGDYKYTKAPTWNAATGKYEFDINDRSNNGTYYLADKDAQSYCSVVTTGDGNMLYETYGLAGSNIAAIKQEVDDNISSIGMVVERTKNVIDENGNLTDTAITAKGSIIVEAINDYSVAVINADKIKLTGTDSISQALDGTSRITITATSQIFAKASGTTTYSPSSITLTATYSSVIKSFQWYKNDTSISGATTATLTIYPSDIAAQSATYKVVGKDSAGKEYVDVMSIAKLSDGTNGTNGTTYYTWVKYADSPTSGMSDSPDGKTYMGIAYNKTSQTESTNYSDYQWSLIKGVDGTNGKDGTNGTSLRQVTMYTTPNLSMAMIQDMVGRQKETWSNVTLGDYNVGDTCLIAIYVSDKGGIIGYMRCEIVAYNAATKKLTTNNLDFMIGADGQRGQNGRNGSDGYTIVLSDEFIEIPVDKDWKPQSNSSYSCTVSVYRGTSELTATTGVPNDLEFFLEVPTGTTPAMSVSEDDPNTVVISANTLTAIPESITLPIYITVDAELVALSAKINVKAKMGVINQINIDKSGITIDANKLNISTTDYVKFTDLTSNTSTVINGNYITTGKISAQYLDLSNYATQDSISSTIKSKLDGMSLSVTNGTKSSTIALTYDGVNISSQTIQFTGNIVFKSDLSTAGSTQIDGSNITTGTISADRIQNVSRIYGNKGGEIADILVFATSGRNIAIGNADKNNGLSTNLTVWANNISFASTRAASDSEYLVISTIDTTNSIEGISYGYSSCIYPYGPSGSQVQWDIGNEQFPFNRIHLWSIYLWDSKNDEWTELKASGGRLKWDGTTIV